MIKLLYISLLATTLSGCDRLREFIPTRLTYSETPEVAIVSPDEDLQFSKGTEIDIVSSVSPTFKVARVEYYADGQTIGQLTEPPYILKYKVAGTSSLIAVAFNSAGQKSISLPVPVRTRPTVLPQKIAP